MPAEFFGERQGAAVLKHAILERYLRIFVQKTGSRGNGRVAYVDGFAGPGLYDDGSPGSPAVAVDTARAATAADGGERVDGFFVEENPESCAALRSYLAAQGLGWKVYEGDVEQHLPSIVAAIPANEASFMFLDPFGLGVPREMLTTIMGRAGTMSSGVRFGGAATELLLNFSFPGLRRNAGHLMSEKTGQTYLKARTKIIARVDASMGGSWWQEIWASEAADRESQILRRYAESFNKSGWSVWIIPVADRWKGPPSYALVLLTQHPDGMWLFHETVSNAMEVYRTWCYDSMGELDFEPIEVRKAQWVDAIASNIEALLGAGPFQVQRKMSEVYGSTLTFARETHVRSAIKKLYGEGKTSTNGVGKIQTMWVQPPPK